MSDKAGLSATAAWLSSLSKVQLHGDLTSPRGQLTRELLSHQLVIEASRPVVCVAERKMNYAFMAAEALWILHGDNSVNGIAPWNSKIAQYSDDGHTFFGAYGPPVIGQLDYVVSKLVDDLSTRQAVLTIWRQNPPPTKDYPCTVAMSFTARAGRLDSHVFMRSNDAWLGTVYDVFNFSMILAKVACMVNTRLGSRDRNSERLALGRVFLTAASFHLYEQHFEAASLLLHPAYFNCLSSTPVPQAAILTGDWGIIERGLYACRDKDVLGAEWNPRPE